MKSFAYSSKDTPNYKGKQAKAYFCRECFPRIKLFRWI